MLKAGRHQYSTPALEKGLDILELFTREPGGLAKTDIARRLNRTVSEIFRMLLCLENRGYIIRGREDDRFHLTLKLFRMSMEYPPTRRLIAEALPHMESLAHDIQQSCHLGVLQSGQVVIIAGADSPISPGCSVKTGSVVDLMHAATGHVVLAHLPNDARKRALRVWSEFTGNRIPKNLDEHLRRIHARGYEERASYEIRGVLNISYPVLDERGTALGALTVPYITRIGGSKNLKDVHAALRKASQALTEVVGGTPQISKK